MQIEIVCRRASGFVQTPLQTVDSMYMLQTDNGKIQMRVVTGKLQRFDNDSVSYEYFPDGLWVYAYTDDEVLESTIVSDEASHERNKKPTRKYGRLSET